MTSRRILGIDPSSRYVGFAVLEDAGLIDWGNKSTGKANSKRALEIIQALVARFEPQTIAIEDTRSRGSRRRSRVRKLLDEVVSLGRASMTVRRIPMRRVVSRDHLGKVLNKNRRALALAKRFPELESRLPRPRKPWMSEDERTNIFDALEFALACVPKEPKKVDEDISQA